MSYVRHYSKRIFYSGSVSYPASQNGGSVSYSGEVPVYISVYVDTDNFDRGINRCNNSVKLLTSAVVATDAAQVESKKKASEKIGAAIVKGFFNYVGADLSQKIKELSSKCEALWGALTGHIDNCRSKKSQMQTDYNRICKRYIKVFEDLDNELVHRIEEMDKPVFDFANESQKVIDRTVDTDLLGISTISSTESIHLETILSCSHVKQEASNLIERSNEYLRNTYRLEHSIRDMLYYKNSNAIIYIPVMYSESTNSNGQKDEKIYFGDSEYGLSGADEESNILSKFMSKDIHWGPMDPMDAEKIISYINSDIQANAVDDRVLRTMLDLLNKQNIQTIKVQ